MTQHTTLSLLGTLSSDNRSYLTSDGEYSDCEEQVVVGYRIQQNSVIVQWKVSILYQCTWKQTEQSCSSPMQAQVVEIIPYVLLREEEQKEFTFSEFVFWYSHLFFFSIVVELMVVFLMSYTLVLNPDCQLWATQQLQ